MMALAKRLGLGMLLGAGLMSQGAMNPASAQDLLPDDNGIFHYHKSPRWRESEAHPLRIGAYIFHPIGWALREGIFRPISYLAGSSATTRSVFGFREPYDYRIGSCFEDNVPNCKDVAPYANLGKSVESAPEMAVDTAAEQKVIFPDVAFDFDKSTLNPLGKARARQAAELLSSMPTVKVVVEGHTDYIGSDDYNMKLGMRRAESVVKELTELGVDPGRMSPISFGESRPLYTEQTDWARAANRRVQFSVKGAEVDTTAGLPAAAQ
jgi:outer membrane protein OmpA-like peptidoglycan-associated protein